jgi:hypothetical protein
MNFFSNRIVTSSALSLEEAARKAKEAPAVRSLDQILSDLDNQNKGIKTASSAATVKTAAKEEKEEEKAEKKTEKAEKAEKKEKKAEEKEEKAEEKEAASKKPTKLALKVASSLDFRSWEATDVVRAWEQHGSFQKCCKNVAGKANDPRAYCGLLQVASTEASRIVKTAKLNAQKKTANSEKPQGRFQKLAKLSEKDRNLLASYWEKLFGPAYVKAMLEDN